MRVVAEEVLKPGALYRECAIVQLEVPPPAPETEENGTREKKDGDGEGENGGLEDDGELGGEALGRAVWEWYEAKLKVWEGEETERLEQEKVERTEREEVAGKEEPATVEGERRVRFAAS